VIYAIIGVLIFCGIVLGHARYVEVFGARDELRKIRKQNERNTR